MKPATGRRIVRLMDFFHGIFLAGDLLHCIVLSRLRSGSQVCRCKASWLSLFTGHVVEFMIAERHRPWLKIDFNAWAVVIDKDDQKLKYTSAMEHDGTVRDVDLGYHLAQKTAGAALTLNCQRQCSLPHNMLHLYGDRPWAWRWGRRTQASVSGSSASLAQKVMKSGSGPGSECTVKPRVACMLTGTDLASGRLSPPSNRRMTTFFRDFAKD